MDRIEQSFKYLFKRTDLIVFSALAYLWFYIVINFVLNIGFTILKIDYKFFEHIINYYVMAVVWIIFLGISVISIWITIGLIRNISIGLKWWNEELAESVAYWFRNIWNSFYTYFFIFMYVYFWPAIILIAWMVLILISVWVPFLWIPPQPNTSNFAAIGFWILSLNMFLFFYFAFYRWVRSLFAIYYAVDKNDYSKWSFEKSLLLTKWNWSRIIGNIFLFWIIMAIISWIIATIFKTYWTTDLISSLILKGNTDPKMISPYLRSYFSISIAWVLNSFLEWIKYTLNIIFFYIFFSRLSFESWDGQKNENGIVEIVEL
jgi:hypothetical protein